MADELKPRRRRWRVTLYNPLAFRRLDSGANLYTDAFCRQEAEASSMGRAFHRALTAGGGDFLAQPPIADALNPHNPGYDFCGVAVHAFEMARAAMLTRSGPAYRVAVTVRGFTVEIERIR